MTRGWPWEYLPALPPGRPTLELPPGREASAAPAGGPASAERAVERLAEDERLRRGLPDAAFGPLLDLTSRLAAARASRYSSTDALYRALKLLLAGAASYSRSGETADLAAGLAAALDDAEARETLVSLGGAATPEARAADLARGVARSARLEGASP